MKAAAANNKQKPLGTWFLIINSEINFLEHELILLKTHQAGKEEKSYYNAKLFKKSFKTIASRMK